MFVDAVDFLLLWGYWWVELVITLHSLMVLLFKDSIIVILMLFMINFLCFEVVPSKKRIAGVVVAHRDRDGDGGGMYCCSSYSLFRHHGQLFQHDRGASFEHTVRDVTRAWYFSKTTFPLQNPIIYRIDPFAILR